MSNKPYYQSSTLRLYLDDFLSVDIPQKVNLTITSPPYNVGINYAGSTKDNLTQEQYLEWSAKWLEKLYQITADNGRLCVNVAWDTSVLEYTPLAAMMINTAVQVGWKYRTTVVWEKPRFNTAYGSFNSANAPNYIPPIEVIPVFYKGDWKREGGTSTITKQNFMEWISCVWRIKGAYDPQHPAPFPAELPKRLIELFSYKDDVILDPFVGSGTTLVAAFMTGRQGIGVEKSTQYAKNAKIRLENLAVPISLLE